MKIEFPNETRDPQDYLYENTNYVKSIQPPDTNPENVDNFSFTKTESNCYREENLTTKYSKS